MKLWHLEDRLFVPFVMVRKKNWSEMIIMENFLRMGNLNDLIDKIDSLLSDKEKSIQMGKNSCLIIKNEVNIHTVIKGYIEAFNYVTNNEYNLSYKQ